MNICLVSYKHRHTDFHKARNSMCINATRSKTYIYIYIYTRVRIYFVNDRVRFKPLINVYLIVGNVVQVKRGM
jgi:hypothetical protein